MSPIHSPETLTKVIAWLLSGETGVSSETIVSAVLGIEYEGASPPQDSGDFGRCLELLTRIPELRPQLGKVAEAYPDWAPLVKRWRELEYIYHEEVERGDGRALRLNNRIQDLLEDH